MFLYSEIIFAEKSIVDKYCEYINVITNYTGSNINKIIKYVENHDTYLSAGDLGYTKYKSSLEIAKEI